MAASFRIYSLFRREAPKFNRYFLSYSSRVQNAVRLPRLPGPLKVGLNPSSSRSVRLSSTQVSSVRSDVITEKPNATFLLSLLARGNGQDPFLDQIREEDATGRYSFPKVSSKAVAYWLLGSAASIFGIVVFGGLTRLTESGCVSSWTSFSR